MGPSSSHPLIQCFSESWWNDSSEDSVTSLASVAKWSAIYSASVKLLYRLFQKHNFVIYPVLIIVALQAHMAKWKDLVLLKIWFRAAKNETNE
jgi:hypothetical protein